MCKEFVDRVPLSGVDTEQMSDEVLGGRRNVVPPGRKEGIVPARDLFSEDVDTLVVEGCVSAISLFSHYIKGDVRGKPQSRVYRTQPKAHMSTDLEYRSSLTISGAV